MGGKRLLFSKGRKIGNFEGNYIFFVRSSELIQVCKLIDRLIDIMTMPTIFQNKFTQFLQQTYYNKIATKFEM